MSRSYKKHPIYTDRARGAKYWKRQANRKVRHYKDRVLHNDYKRLYCSWEIHDWVSRWDRAEAIKDYYTHIYFCLGKPYAIWDDYETEQHFLNRYWAKYYKRK